MELGQHLGAVCRADAQASIFTAAQNSWVLAMTTSNDWVPTCLCLLLLLRGASGCPPQSACPKRAMLGLLGALGAEHDSPPRTAGRRGYIASKHNGTLSSETGARLLQIPGASGTDVTRG